MTLDEVKRSIGIGSKKSNKLWRVNKEHHLEWKVFDTFQEIVKKAWITKKEMNEKEKTNTYYELNGYSPNYTESKGE